MAFQWLFITYSFFFDILRRKTTFSERHSLFVAVVVDETSLLKFSVLTSLLTWHMSCHCPWARQNFPALLKLEQTPSHRQERVCPRLCQCLIIAFSSSLLNMHIRKKNAKRNTCRSMCDASILNLNGLI